jgi:hypothetical protein
MFRLIYYILILFFIITLTDKIYSQSEFVFIDKYEKNTSILSQSDSILTVNGSWIRLNNLPSHLIGVNAFYNSINNKIFICGGLNSNFISTDTCYWYDITSNTFQIASYLPQGRWAGKLVKVKNDLFLISSRASSTGLPDGIVYKYSLLNNIWSVYDTMPLQKVYESAVSVLNDSLIIIIGGSTNGFIQPKNNVWVYNPFNNNWIQTSSIPVNITTAHSEIYESENDTSIFVYGGYNSSGFLNTVYKGRIFYLNDTLRINWSLFTYTPDGIGAYRVSGAKWKDDLLFGPAMNSSLSLNNIWGLSFSEETGYWTKFTPGTIDTTANISSFAVKSDLDSNYFYVFGGFKNPNFLNAAQRYSFKTPPPIKIINNQHNIPASFKLYQNYPNPFNPNTKIKFDYLKLNNLNEVILKIYDISGKILYHYIFTNLKTGTYEIEIDMQNCSSGIYFYSLADGNSIKTQKMILIK